MMDKLRIFEMSQGLHDVESRDEIDQWFRNLKKEIPFDFSIVGKLSDSSQEQPICIDFPLERLQSCLSTDSLCDDFLLSSMLNSNSNVSALLDPIVHPEYGKRLIIAGRLKKSELSVFMLSFGDRQPSEEEISSLYLLAPHIYLASNKLSTTGSPTLPDLCSMTAREKELIHWLKIGKSNWEISRLIGTSERTG
ncbi:MAG: LuxR C-terminal-related transcriptional regulator [Endozoicomonas sp.]|uniref:LuxR C-terminal-related transcriptional regulator n=1 Tax=Endozoicomonas sp. TaxID=1892382 RepID=UPI003D9BB04B